MSQKNQGCWIFAVILDTFLDNTRGKFSINVFFVAKIEKIIDVSSINLDVIFESLYNRVAEFFGSITMIIVEVGVFVTSCF